MSGGLNLIQITEKNHVIKVNEGSVDLVQIINYSKLNTKKLLI